MSTSPKPSAWEKAKHGGKATFDRAWAGFEKLGVPVNKLTNKIGSEAFWPTTLDHESDKAARVLKSFCKDGFYTEQPAPAKGSPGPRNKPKVLVKIPQKVIQNCVGLAIFTVMRTGLWVSGAGGSGVLIARKEDGSWSPPAGLLVHTLGVGFMAGIDIYDCVIVINDRKALAAFSKLRVSLGGELSVVAGPVGAGGIIESEVLKDRKPVWSYMKSRGLYGGLQFDGTVIVERNDENARFYGERIPVGDILAGKVRRIPPETRMLAEVVKQAEGRTDVDHGVLHQADLIPPPSEIEIEQMSEATPQQVHAYAPPSNYGYGYPQGQGHGQSQPQAPYYPPPPPGTAPHNYSTQNYSGQSYSGQGYHPGDVKTPAYPPRPTSQGHPDYPPPIYDPPAGPPPPRDEKHPGGPDYRYS